MKRLSQRERRAALISFREAVRSLCNCWDALRDLEDLFGCEVETDDISPFAGDDDWSEDALQQLIDKLKEEGR